MGAFTDLIDASDGSTRQALERVRDLVAEHAPEATEGVSYGAASFLLDGKALIGVSIAKSHLSLVPFSPPAIAAVAGDLTGYPFSKGVIRFTGEQPLPDAVIVRLIELRTAEIRK